jgi:hypothetical protein
MQVMIPIPFFGWWVEDEDNTQEMLRDQIHIQQHRIEELEAECSALIKQIGEVK